MSTDSTDHSSDGLVTPDLEVHIPPARTEPDAAPQQTFSRDGTSSGHTKRKLRRRVLPIASALVVCVAAALYYLRFIAPFESTDDAFIEGHVTQVAPQVAGRIARVLVNDNQFVNASEVLVQIEPSDYEAKLEQARASLASARSRLGEASAQLTVDRAKTEQEKA